MPRGGGAGGAGRGKKIHKGQRRHFSDENELEEQAKKAAREREWRMQRGDKSDEEEDGARNRGLPPTDSESDSDDSSEEEAAKPKGVSHLIEIENPNRAGGKAAKKISEMGEGGVASLSRREREEIQKQEARQRYEALHKAGKTEEAQADLARLAIIRRQREEAAKKRETDIKEKEDAKGKGKGKS